MKLDEMGDWRRTHKSSEITEKLDGEEVIVMGRVGDIRDLGGIKFFVLFDIGGTIQITAPKKKIAKEMILTLLDKYM